MNRLGFLPQLGISVNSDMTPSHRLMAARCVCAALLALSLLINIFGGQAAALHKRVQVYRPTAVNSATNVRIFDRDRIKRQGLDVTSKRRLEEAKTSHDERVWFIAAAQRDENPKVAMLLKHIGGEIVFQADEIDYIRGSIPTAKAEEFAADENVMDISLGEGSGPGPLLDHDEARNTPAARYKPMDFLPTVDPAPEPTPGNPDDVLKREAPYPPQFLNETFSPQLSGDKHLPTKSLPVNELAALNPYLPTYLMGAPQFIQRHPNFDGRGVTIAIVGAVGDVDHPMLQHGRLLDGTMVNKVVDILDPSVRSMLSLLPEDLKEITTDPDSSFIFEGQKYFAPRSGTYRFGIVNSQEWSSNLKLAGGLAAIWDEVRNLVWIDAHRQRDFRILTPITDYGLRQQQIRIPGQDDGLTASLVVKTYPKEHVLKVFTSSIHETQVASVAAGNAFIGSQATGVAPAARVVYVVPSRESLIEAYLLAAKDPRVDLISSSFEPDSSLEGEDVFCELLNRIIKHYQKPVLKAAGNAGAVLDSVRGMACATEVLAIASYSTRSSEDANATSAYVANEAEYVNEEGGSGPSGLGALKPDLLAPSPNSRGTPCDATRVSRSDFEIVRCYAMGGGQTSMAAPMAAGAVALLISAAKQSGLPHGNDLLRYALMSSARHLESWPIDRQGGGLIQIGSAWEQLKFAAAHLPEEILGTGPVSFVTAYNKTPGYGVGIYELQGGIPGTRASEAWLSIVRTARTGRSSIR